MSLIFIIGIIACIFHQETRLNFYDPVNNPVQKITIMGYGEDRTVKFIQSIFQHLTGGNIQVIGWLIENEEICAREGDQGNLQASTFTPRERPNGYLPLLISE